MKNFIIILLFAFVSCGTQSTYKLDKKAPIVDYNQPYDYYNRNRSYNEAVQRHNDQTVYLFNGKEITHKKLKQLLEKKRIKSLENILDQGKITQLGYSHDTVKRILLTSSR